MGQESGKKPYGKENLSYAEFWSLDLEAGKTVLQTMSEEEKINLLRLGMGDRDERAMMVLHYLEDENVFLVPRLRSELVYLLNSENPELNMRAGALLAREVPGYLTDRPHLGHRLAGLAQYSPESESRYKLIVSLASISEKKQQFMLYRCPDRDHVVKKLKKGGEAGTLLSFLRVSFARWEPEMDELEDLRWMLKVLDESFEELAGESIKMVLGTGKAKRCFQSRALLEVLTEEACEAAAACIVRCLRGPGGDHRLGELEYYLANPRLGDKVLEILSHSPGSFGLLVEEGLPRWCRQTVPPVELIRKVCLGIRAAHQSLAGLLKQCLSISSESKDAAAECNRILAPVKETLVPFTRTIMGNEKGVEDIN